MRGWTWKPQASFADCRMLLLLPQLLSRFLPGIPPLLALLGLTVRRLLVIDKTRGGKMSVKVPLAVKGRFWLLGSVCSVLYLAHNSNIPHDNAQVQSKKRSFGRFVTEGCLNLTLCWLIYDGLGVMIYHRLSPAVHRRSFHLFSST